MLSFAPEKSQFIIKLFAFDSVLQFLNIIYLLVLLNIFLFVVSFMKGFKRKGHSSLLKHLKTHCKFSLIETFLETLTDSSKQVMYIVQDIFWCTFRVISSFRADQDQD